jgi:tetratricopeptide (TPR) repeat protein
MKPDKEQSNAPAAKTLNWILALAIALVACAIAFVAWFSVDSLQKHTHKLTNYHVTEENTKISTHNYDVLKKSVQKEIATEQLDPNIAFQEILIAPEGSEILMNNGRKAVDTRQYAQGAEYFTQALAMIPQEAKKKTAWHSGVKARDKNEYTGFAYEERSLCYLELGDFKAAIADLTGAIKLSPDHVFNYKNRARAYYQIGKKDLAAADTKTAQAMAIKDSLHP